MSARFFLLCGLLLMMIGVISGAFGAHAIKNTVSITYQQTWQTATEYLFYHALGLIALGSYYRDKSLDRWARASGLLFMLGIVLFSGSLYLLVLTGQSSLGMITPFGGTFFILGWASWLVSAGFSGQT